MAMTTGPSRYAMKMNYLYIAMCVGFTIYMIYDGYFSQKFIEENTREDNTPNVTLQINKTWGPISLVGLTIWFGYSTLMLKRRKLTVDEKGLTFEDGTVIPLDSLTKIDKSKLKNRGKIFIDYEANGETKTIKLKDSIYDDVDGVLEEILKLTGKGEKKEQSEEEVSENNSADKTQNGEQ